MISLPIHPHIHTIILIQIIDVDFTRINSTSVLNYRQFGTLFTPQVTTVPFTFPPLRRGQDLPFSFSPSLDIQTDKFPHFSLHIFFSVYLSEFTESFPVTCDHLEGPIWYPRDFSHSAKLFDPQGIFPGNFKCDIRLFHG
jgi:hypothetical protein